MDGRSEFFVYMGAAIGTAVTLFVVQQVYASYLDVSVVHGRLQDAPRDAKIVAMREAEQKALAGGKMPIEQAMDMLAQRGRGASNMIAPVQSQDVSAMSGWAFRHGFTAYEPRRPTAPAVPAEPAEGTVPADGSAPADGAAPAEGAAPAAAAAQPAAPAPAAAPAAAPAQAGHATH